MAGLRHGLERRRPGFLHQRQVHSPERVPAEPVGVDPQFLGNRPQRLLRQLPVIERKPFRQNKGERCLKRRYRIEDRRTMQRFEAFRKDRKDPVRLRGAQAGGLAIRA